jgi:Double-GTPase 2
MTTPTGKRVRCPICLESFTWREDELYRRVVDDKGARWVKADLSGFGNEVKRKDRRARCYVKCPNPGKENHEHYLPVSHRDHGDPIVVGMVGRHASGKTHLLTAMIHEALRGDLRHHGLTFEPADELRHAAFQREIEQLMRGNKLNATKDLREDFATYLLVRTTSGTTRPIVFFDVAGEDFVQPGPHSLGGQFVLGATALMFVDHPSSAVPALRGAREMTGNPAFSGALERMGRREDMTRLPVAVVLTKADELRYEHPVDYWIRRDDLREPLDAGAFRAESRDVYAFLDRFGARPMLDVFERFRRSTLHVVSATGAEADDNNLFPRGVRPARVLRPLLALLAMSGLVDHPEAAEVGT